MLPQMMPPVVRQAAARRLLQLKRARSNFTEFVRAVGINAEGDPLDLAPLHLAWHAHVDYCWTRGLYAGIMSHFGSGKSSSFAVPLIAWWLGRNPTASAQIVCNDDESARRRVQLVGKIITDVPAYRAVFPSVEPGEKWTEHELVLKRGGLSQDPSVLGRGVMTIGIGSHCKIQVLDDVCDEKNSRKQALRKEVRERVRNTWMTRIDPGGHALWIATPWNLDDTTHHLMQTPGWCFLVQEVQEDLETIVQKVYGAGDDYPLLAPP